MSVEIESLIKNEEQEFNEIEKMAHSSGSCDHPDRHCLERYGDCRECSVYGICERLATQGYGDKKQAIKEFAEKLKECQISVSGIKVVTVKQIDILFNELYDGWIEQ